ncbi:nudix hydrolase 2 [Corylus avellana]|uniref:nudix hydrolase 2 n=1 Tax=Corylus avellana TaxID=13451 RepID=UPI00286AC3E7|nr:nudix hydrolase 2 [Corylus avellana]
MPGSHVESLSKLRRIIQINSVCWCSKKFKAIKCEDVCYSQHENSLYIFTLRTKNTYRLWCRTSVGDMPGKEIVVVSESEWQSVKLLTAVEDPFGGLTVEMADQPMDAAVFATKLRASISCWRLQGKKGVWMKIPIEQSSLVDVAVKEGFSYHHAEPQYLMLIYWLPQGTHSLPGNATHRVGIAAFVMNDRRELLVVQEKLGFFRGKGIWKLPTGVVDEGEDIFAAAEREVKEETGIDAEFVEVLAFRQSLKAFFQKSDLCFVCMLRPLSFDIKIQESEIDAARWMPFEEYVAQPFIQKDELMNNVADICLGKIERKYSGFTLMRSTSSISGKERGLYSNRPRSSLEEYAAQPFIQEDGFMNSVADICLEKIDRKYSGFTLMRSTSSISGKERDLYSNRPKSSLEEYAAQPFIQEDGFMNSVADICLEKIDRKYSGFTLMRSTSSISGKERDLYSNRPRPSLEMRSNMLISGL